MVDQTEFTRLVRDALANLYDYAALETHPLADLLPRPPGYSGRRANYLSDVLQQAIEELKPPAREPASGSVEWRPYLILRYRYVECLELREIQARLSLSERQLRREHSRAVKAIAASLWDRFLAKQLENGWWGREFRAFEVTCESLDLAEVMRGVIRTLERRMQSEGTGLVAQIPPEPLHVLADRVVLRQVLISLLNYALERRASREITLGVEAQSAQVTLWIEFQTAPGSPMTSRLEDKKAFEAVQYWTRRLNATLSVTPTNMSVGLTRLWLTLPRAAQLVVMVVDDQAAAIQMFRRYLSQSGVHVVGVQNPEQTLALASQLQPCVITLDVMMPTMDGWELLQALQAHPDTRHIPVIVCSVWDEPELAFSLGAAEFLKKPVTQKALLDALTRLGVLGTPAVQPPVHSPKEPIVHDEIEADAS